MELNFVTMVVSGIGHYDSTTPGDEHVHENTCV